MPVPADPSETDWRGMIEAAVRDAGLHPVFQPVVDVARGTVVGYEALSRFADQRVRDPQRWFAAARRLGLVGPLEAAALRGALAQRATLPPNCFLSVNVEPEALTTPEVAAVWADTGDLHGVFVEITEHSRIEKYRDFHPKLAELRAAGAMVAVDDVGSGYAGLTHLIELRPAMIKLDRALVSGIDRDEAKRSLAEMIGTFAGRVDAWLLAEGVETAGELGTVAGLRVPLAQGFHLGMPGEPWQALSPEVARLLRRVTDAVGTRSSLAPFLEHPTTAVSVEEAQAVLASGQDDVVAVVPNGGPALRLVLATDPSGTGEHTLRMSVDTAPADAVLRALTRPRAHWTEPVLCTDATGRHVGVVRLERLVHHLAREAVKREP